MFCENCGNKIDSSHKFCTKCGNSTVQHQPKTNVASQPALTLNDKWWHRLLRVLYVISYLPLLIIIPVVWSENNYSYYGSGSSDEAFWYSLLTLVIYVIIARLIKIAVLYIALGRKPEWKKELKRLF